VNVSPTLKGRARQAVAAEGRPLAYELDLSQQLARLRPAMLFDGATPAALRDWQARFRETLVRLLWEIPERGRLDLRFESETAGDGFVRHKVSYQSEPGLRVPAWLLVPAGAGRSGRAPGVLFLHGHSDFGKDNVAGIDTSPRRRVELKRFRMDVGPTLARAGFVVLAPDLRGFGERCVDYPGARAEYCPRNYLVATMLGTTVAAQHVCDLTAALDVLEGLPVVDGRLACAGLSLGGRMTMLITALDRRVQVCVPSGCLNLLQERFQALGQCGAQTIPGLLRYGDTPEIFSLIAPRPMVIEWGRRDPLVPHDWAERGLERIRRAYAAAGAADQLQVDRFDGGHQFHGTVGLDRLQRWKEDRA
jgi:dienelactone hydrolase